MLKFFNTYYPIRNLIFFLGEGLLIFTALFLGARLRYHGVMPHETARLSLWVRILAITVLVQISLYYHDLYSVKERQKMLDLSLRIIQAIGVSCIILALVYYLYPPLIVEQGAFFVALFLILFFLVSWRFGYELICQTGFGAEKVILVGNGKLATLICDEITSNLDSGYKIKAIMDKDPKTDLPDRLGVDFYPDYQKMCSLALEEGVSKIIVALDEKRGKFPAQELLQCRMAGIAVMDGITFYEALSGKILVKGTLPSWLIFSNGFRRHRWTQWTKRLLDLFLAGVGMVVTAPVMFVIAIAIKTDSRGPVIYRQLRTGQREKPFYVLKFRTMVQDAEKLSGPVWASERDPRITRVGRVLRKLRLDELPQFWNIVKGEMSFVGPRPERPIFVEELKKKIPYYSERHTVKPGLTGWAQVNYPYGACEEDALKKLEYDLFYVKNFSLLLDLYIVLKTIQIVLFGRGAR